MRIPSPFEMVSRPLTKAELAAGELLPQVLTKLQEDLQISSYCDYPLPFGMANGSIPLLKQWLEQRNWSVTQADATTWRIRPNQK